MAMPNLIPITPINTPPHLLRMESPMPAPTPPPIDINIVAANVYSLRDTLSNMAAIVNGNVTSQNTNFSALRLQIIELETKMAQHMAIMNDLHPAIDEMLALRDFVLKFHPHAMEEYAASVAAKRRLKLDVAAEAAQ